MPRNSFMVGVVTPRNTPSSVPTTGPDSATPFVAAIAIRTQAAAMFHPSRDVQFRFCNFFGNLMEPSIFGGANYISVSAKLISGDPGQKRSTPSPLHAYFCRVKSNREERVLRKPKIFLYLAARLGSADYNSVVKEDSY